ncbi:MAG: hypothetical protein D6820_05340, partial [Lentisphaerae bacterium]
MSESRQGHAGEPALPERDRLYREWILPHLSLNEEDAGRLRTILGIDDLRGFYSLPASREVPLDELAPVDDLRAMPPCLVSKASITIWAPREGAILVPVTDPRGRYNAFQFITPAQLAQWEEKGSPGRFYW